MREKKIELDKKTKRSLLYGLKKLIYSKKAFKSVKAE